MLVPVWTLGMSTTTSLISPPGQLKTSLVRLQVSTATHHLVQVGLQVQGLLGDLAFHLLLVGQDSVQGSLVLLRSLWVPSPLEGLSLNLKSKSICSMSVPIGKGYAGFPVTEDCHQEQASGFS